MHGCMSLYKYRSFFSDETAPFVSQEGMPRGYCMVFDMRARSTVLQSDLLRAVRSTRMDLLGFIQSDTKTGWRYLAALSLKH